MTSFELAQQIKRPQRKSSRNLEFATPARKNSKNVSSQSQLDLSGDLLDIGVIAFTLLNDAREISDLVSV